MFKVNCYKPWNPNEPIRVGAIVTDEKGAPVLQLPTGPFTLNESTLGPQWEEVNRDSDDYDADDSQEHDRFDAKTGLYDSRITRQQQNWDVTGDVPRLTLHVRETMGDWPCRWSLEGGVLSIHQITADLALDLPLGSIWGQQALLATPPTPQATGSIGIVFGEVPPAPQSIRYDGNGVFSILQPTVVGTVGVPIVQSRTV